MKPLGVMLVCSALLVAAIAIDNPILLASIAVCALALLLAGPGSKRAYLVFAGTSALLVFLINPFVSVQGLTPIWHGPHIPLLDTEITQEELAFGAAAALRIFASALAFAAFVRIADGDLVLNGVSRVAPRSAMIVALAARLLPTLERDAAGIVLAARARGATGPAGDRPPTWCRRWSRSPSSGRCRWPRRWRHVATAAGPGRASPGRPRTDPNG